MISRGIRFGEIHSYHDLNLILAPFTLTPAKPKTSYIDIPGGDGSLDLTEALGEVKFDNRDFTFTFSVNPSDEMTFDEKVMQVSNALNGKKCNITIDRDPDWYWVGRCTVDQYAQDRNLKKIVIKATVHPYKLKQTVTVATYTLVADVPQVVVLKNNRKSVVPEITCGANNMVVEANYLTKNLSAGTHKILDFQLVEGNNVFKLSGSGSISFKYQEGAL